MITVIPADVQQAVIARVRAGEKQLAIAADLGMSRQAVGRLARIHGHARTRRDPMPLTAAAPARDTTWMARGNCTDHPTFGDWPVPAQVEWCQGCPVQAECLEYGLAGAPLHGDWGNGAVYGGVTPRSLRKLQRLQAEQQARADRMRREVAS